MKARALLLVVCACMIAPFARADTPPSVWDLAKDPKERARWELHARVSQLLTSPRELSPRMRSLPADQARDLLEAADAANSPDVRLRFDLGRAYEQSDRHQKAIDVLQPAVDSAPSHPGAADALLALAYAYAKLDKPRGERDAYKRYLRIVTTDGARATATLNLAEAEMRLGNLPDAVFGYGEALDQATRIASMSGGSLTAVLGVWGLAVALDRSGDPVGAAKEAKLANQLDPGQRVIGDTTTGQVFFEPRHERFWYTALGAQEEARATADPRGALRLWRVAYERWTAYITGAERHTSEFPDWLPLARAHQASAKKELAAAERRAARAPKPPPSLIDVDE